MFQSTMRFLVLLYMAAQLSAAVTRGAKPHQIISHYKRAPLQNIVTWDEHSLMVNGSRVMWFSGEFHPFRLPVAGLYLDVFQKIKAMGYNGVSFYTDWALLEGQPGVFNSSGIFYLQPFFDAASEAGIFLLARPGPYINAEVSGGGFPGWMQRNAGRTRTRDPAFLHATDYYVSEITKIIAKAQITNGGPIILVQPENEYTSAVGDPRFPDPVYMDYVENQYRNAGIVVPLISNDASPAGHNAPSTGLGAVDIYGHDGYPLGFDCRNPYTWPAGVLPTNFGSLHQMQSPITPYSIIEFQGGSFDPWGGLGFAQCAVLLNEQFERVFWKNDYSFGVTIFNVYMVFGGTNWGNLGHPGGYTSYDYGATITEDRLVTREKYSEAKLQANFLRASPAYLTASFITNRNATGAFTNSSSLFTTELTSGSTRFLVLRHTAYYNLSSTSYVLQLPTSLGRMTVPQLGGALTLNGRDSKVHVLGYAVGKYSLQYSSAEIFTWQSVPGRTVLIVYGGPGERHELAFAGVLPVNTVEGSGVQTAHRGDATILNWQTSATRRVVQVNHEVFVYLLDRNSAYTYWVLDLPRTSSSNYTVKDINANTVIVRAGYLMRTASISGSTLALTGDLNATVPFEVIATGTTRVHKVTFNGKGLETAEGQCGRMESTLIYNTPTPSIPNLLGLRWKYVDSLPEIQLDYDDSAWIAANLSFTYNTYRNLSTPMSLYSSDYGFHTGSLIYRGHFIATGSESTLTLWTQGGSAYGHSAWVGDDFIGSWTGIDAASNCKFNHTLPTLTAGRPYVLTVLIDHMGNDENWPAGDSGFKNPRGIMDYSLAGHKQADVSWKLTGNLGGEAYIDKTRGPLNEGAMFAERQGFHLPSPPSSSWASRSPATGISSAGVGFFSASFPLDMPSGYDIPLAFAFENTTVSATMGASAHYRVQLFVNGYQFGKLVSNIGPQTVFRVPEGILNYHGTNYVALTLWSQDAGGARVANLSLVATAFVQTGLQRVQLSPMPPYTYRAGAY